MAELSRRSFLKGLAGVVAGLVIPEIWIPRKTEAADIEIYRGNVISSQDPIDYYGDRPSHPYKSYQDDKALLSAMDKNEISYLLVPRTEYMDTILQKKYWINYTPQSWKHN